MATAEVAMVLPLITLLVLLAAAVVGGIRDGVRCQQAAAVAARAAARGESMGVVAGLARASAPSGADVVVTKEADTVLVTVTTSAGIPGPWSGAGPNVTVRGSAQARVE
jgi:Flp pilus assembly protein TadG